MPRNARVPKIDRTDKRLQLIADTIAEVTNERRHSDSWMDTSEAAGTVVADAMWLREQDQLEAARTTEARVIINGEPYKRLEQESSCLYHGLWGAHVVVEHLYRREDVRNGPTIHPLDMLVGIVDGSLLPDLALAAGGLAAVQTTREVEATLERLGL
jgi:hypothetical protein